MTSKGSGREPSMDEIMSQIRSIIAADESKGRPAAPRGADKGSDGDVLELTEMVNDDGSVSRIDAGADKSAATTGPRSGPLAESEDGFVATPAPPAELAPIFAAGGGNEPRTPPQSPPPRPAPPPQPAAAKPVPPPVMPPAAAPMPTVTAQPMMSQPPVSRPVAQPIPQPPPQTAATVAPQPVSMQPMAAPQPPAPPRSAPSTAAAPMSDLLSNAAAGAAASALERLAAVAQQQAKAPLPPAPPIPGPSISGRNLEDLVQDMLRPMLKQWLDTNLPSIVERMVAQEIIKISKR